MSEMSNAPIDGDNLAKKGKPAAIRVILDKVRVVNLATKIDGDVLSKIADQVITSEASDRESMEDWRNAIRKGRQLAVQELQGKSQPWQNAANFKSPVLLNAALKFGDRASLTLLKAKDLIKFDIIGKDPDNLKKDAAERVSIHMNYQLNYEMKTWRDDHDTLLYALGLDGCIFKNTYFDSTLGRNTSEVIRYPNFSVDQRTLHTDTARSFTIARHIDKDEAVGNMRAGIWSDIPLSINTEEEGTETEDDELVEDSQLFFEQNMWYDLDEDGYAEPYTATVHYQSAQVVRLIPRFEEGNIFARIAMKDNDYDGRVVNLKQFQQPQFGDSGLTFKNLKLVRIEPISTLTKYGFLPSVDGTFLNVGYFHLLASLTNGINTSTNHLINAGFLQTSKTTFVAKSFRKKRGDMQMKIGQMNSTDMSAQDLQNGIKIMDFGEPSQTLMALVEGMKLDAQQLSASTDISETIGANAPATTMLGLIHEQMMPVSALIQRIYRAEQQEFRKLFELNAKFTDPVSYKEVTAEDISYSLDYNESGISIMPAANPEMTSRFQKLIQSQAMLEQFDRVLQAGGNPIVILREFFEVIGAQNVDEIFPEQGVEEDPNLQAMRQMQEEQVKLATQQMEILQGQLEIARGKLENETYNSKSERLRAESDAAKAIASIRKMRAESVLKLEEAQTEDLKNDANLRIEGLDKLAKLVSETRGLENDRQSREISRE